MKVRCPGCRAEPRMVGVSEAGDGTHLQFKCVNRHCRYCGRQVAEKVLPKEGGEDNKD